VSVSRPPQRPGHVLVAYRDFMHLRIPIPSTNLAADSGSSFRTPFTREAIRAVLALVQECEQPGPVHGLSAVRCVNEGVAESYKDSSPGDPP
jgi:hypothetical protein